MIGFELQVGGETYSAAVQDGVVTVIATRVVGENRDEIGINFSGLSKEGDKHEHVDWYKADLKVGDEMTIKVIEVEKNSTPVDVRKSKKSTSEQKLNSYLQLKKELENEGLI